MTPTYTQESWARDLLTRMHYPVTQNNMTSVLAWEYGEGGDFANRARFNPLNTTLDHNQYVTINSHGVASYPDYETGMQKTITTLQHSRYADIRNDLANSADPSVTTGHIAGSRWGTWHGSSPQPLIDRAERYMRAHPDAATANPQTAPTTTRTPAPTTAPTPTDSTPTDPAPKPVPAPAPTPTPAPSTGGTTSGTGGFNGADVDGLDKLAQEFQQAAQICDEVKMVCEAIVAAASFFGPFGAAFVAYLKGTVIPWLTKISAALKAMSQLLSKHSQAQKDASSSTTSLPSYVSAGTTIPAGETPASPLSVAAATPTTGPSISAAPAPTNPQSVATHTDSYLGGLVKVGTDDAGRVVSVGVGGQSQYYGTQTDYRVNRDAAGNITSVTSHYDERIGTATNPLVSSSGDTVDTVLRSKDGSAIGLTSSYTDGTKVGGVDLVRETGDLTVAAPNARDVYVDGSAGLVLGPGTGEGTHPAGSLPGGGRLPELPGGEGPIHPTYKPPEVSIGGHLSSGTYGDSVGGSAYGRLLGGTLGGSGSDGALTVGAEGKADASAGAGFFVGSSHWNGETTRGVFGAANAEAGVGFEGAARVGSDHNWAQGTGGFGLSVPGSFNVGGYAVQHGPDAAPQFDLGGNGEINKFGVGGRIHHE